jgi:FkbM family methyltransferase
MTTKELLEKLNTLEAKARGPKLGRLAFAPMHYLFGTFFWKIIYPFSKKGTVRKRTTFFGREMELVLPAGMDIYLLNTKTHDSEIRLTKFIINTIKPGDTFVDAGAHFGFYSLLASHLTGEQGQVYSIEASRGIAEILRKNTKPFKNIKVHNVAVALKEEILEFHEFPILYSEYNTIHPEQFGQSDWIKKNPPQKIKVEANRLDVLIDDWSHQPDFIKIDIEGAEYDAIAGLKGYLQSHKPIIAMEYLAIGRGNHAHQKALQIAKKFGLFPHLIEPDGSLTPVENVDEALINRGLDSDNVVLKEKE